MKYDDVDWHRKGSDESTVAHLGMFVAWLVCNDLVSREYGQVTQEDIDRLTSQEINGTWILENRLDGSLSNGSLTDEGDAFVGDYYDRSYYDDFATAFVQEDLEDVPIQDDWRNFEILRVILDQRFSEWKMQQVG